MVWTVQNDIDSNPYNLERQAVGELVSIPL